MIEDENEPKKENKLKVFLVAVAVAVAAGLGAYTWWASTPYHALRQIKIAIKTHDQERFNKFVDVAELVTTFTDDIMFRPAEQTPNLTRFQKTVGLGAFRIAKVSIDNTLIFQIQKWIARRPDVEHIAELSEKDEDRYLQAIDDEKEASGLAGVLKAELKQEVSKLKDAVYQRMVEYASHRRQTLVNRIFISPEGKKRNTVRKIFRDYGLTRANLRKWETKMAGEKCICTLYFYCPIVEQTVPVKFELDREHPDKLSHYRVRRLIEVRESFRAMGEDTDDQVHGLVASGLKDVTFDSALAKTKSVLKRIAGAATRESK